MSSMTEETEMLVVRVSDGVPLSLQTVWQERRMVLVFLRHLGCRFCLEQTDAIVKTALARRLKEFGIDFALVSLGSLEQARQWQEQTGYSGELYVDPTTSGSPADVDQAGSKTYRTFRLQRGKQVIHNDHTKGKGAATAEKFPDKFAEKQGDILIYPGDVFQVGGAFVLGAGNICDYAVRSQYAGDLLDLDALEVAATGKHSDGTEYVYPSTAQWFSDLKLDTLAASVGVWGASVRPMVCRNWRRAFALSAAMAGLAAFRRNNTRVGVGCLGVAGVVAGSTCITQKRKLAATVKLLTPKTVDKMVLKAGLMQCDCESVLPTIPMDGEIDDVDAAMEPAGPRARTVTWDVTGLDGAKPNEYQTTMCYFRSFLAKPHPSVGRKGPVCPFVPKALQLDTINLSVVRTSSIPKPELRSTLTELLVDYIPKFEALEPTTGRQRQFKTVVFVFPDVDIRDAHDIIDGAQLDSKSEFVSRGLMVGEFHAANNASGLRNPNFFPLRTPFPSLAIRHMVPGDLAFMTLDNYPVDLQLKFLRSFLDVFGDQDVAETRTARERLQKLSGNA